MHTTRQRGMTAVGWLFVLVLVAVFATILIRLVPVYIDGFNVYSSLSSLESDIQAKGKSPLELRKMLMKRLDINMVRDVKTENISFSRDRNGTIVEVDYEVRRKLFGNLFMVVVFNKSVTIPN